MLVLENLETNITQVCSDSPSVLLCLEGRTQRAYLSCGPQIVTQRINVAQAVD